MKHLRTIKGGKTIEQVEAMKRRLKASARKIVDLIFEAWEKEGIDRAEMNRRTEAAQNRARQSLPVRLVDQKEER